MDAIYAIQIICKDSGCYECPLDNGGFAEKEGCNWFAVVPTKWDYDEIEEALK
jgi:hypothetical protein